MGGGNGCTYEHVREDRGSERYKLESKRKACDQVNSMPKPYQSTSKEVKGRRKHRVLTPNWGWGRHIMLSEGWQSFVRTVNHNRLSPPCCFPEVWRTCEGQTAKSSLDVEAAFRHRACVAPRRAFINIWKHMEGGGGGAKVRRSVLIRQSFCSCCHPPWHVRPLGLRV